jgi:hypothetical protein
MFRLAVVASVVALAFLGADSAFAAEEEGATELEKVVWCKVNTSPCPAGKDFPVNSVSHWELKTSTNARFLLGMGEVACTLATATALLETLLVDASMSLLFKNCTSGGEACEVKSEGVNYLAKGELKPGDSGYEILLTRRGAFGQPRFRIECPGINCVFLTTSALLEQVAGASDVIFGVLQTLEAETMICKMLLGNAVWHAEYLARCLESGTLVGCWLVMEE